MIRSDIRNIAIIAHVDHGKTTLVNEMLKQGGVFRQNQEVADRVMDSNDLERERGITILSKNTAVHYHDAKINIVDTPGPADFGGEVERVLKMVDGVLLLVDSFEGPMPQTRFVLSKALELSLPVLICINKVDRPDARCAEVVDEILDLLIELNADPETLERPILYCSARKGTCTLDPDVPGTDLRPLFDNIMKYIPAPEGDMEGPAQVLISTIDYNDYVGRIGVGRISRGTLRAGQMVVRCNYLEQDKTTPPWRLTGLFQYDGLKRLPAESVGMGDIVALTGLEDIAIGDTVCAPEAVEPLPFVHISEPTVTMTFSVNDSPFAGKEGQYVTSRHLRARLYRELQTDMSLRVTDGDTPDCFDVCGRGELHLSILIETMRRQGYEFQVSKPEVIYKEIDGVKCEPIERMVADVPQAYAGAVIEKIGRRRGVLPRVDDQDRIVLEARLHGVLHRCGVAHGQPDRRGAPGQVLGHGVTQRAHIGRIVVLPDVPPRALARRQGRRGRAGRVERRDRDAVVGDGGEQPVDVGDRALRSRAARPAQHGQRRLAPGRHVVRAGRLVRRGVSRHVFYLPRPELPICPRSIAQTPAPPPRNP